MRRAPPRSREQLACACPWIASASVHSGSASRARSVCSMARRASFSGRIAHAAHHAQDVPLGQPGTVPAQRGGAAPPAHRALRGAVEIAHGAMRQSNPAQQQRAALQAGQRLEACFALRFASALVTAEARRWLSSLCSCSRSHVPAMRSAQTTVRAGVRQLGHDQQLYAAGARSCRSAHRCVECVSTSASRVSSAEGRARQARDDAEFELRTSCEITPSAISSPIAKCSGSLLRASNGMTATVGRKSGSRFARRRTTGAGPAWPTR